MNRSQAVGCGCVVLAGGGITCVLAILLFATGIGGMLRQQLTGGAPGSCQMWARGDISGTALTEEQRRNVRIIASVGKTMGIPAEGWVIAIATAIQESNLRNIQYGDRDSLGLFQQRPSMGWGTPDQVTNPRYAARQFYSHLNSVDGWQSMPLTQAAQAVQRSAFPGAYQDHAARARRLVAQLTGGDSGDGVFAKVDFSCADLDAKVAGRGPNGQWLPEEMGPQGLTPRTKRVMELVERRFDEHNIGGFCPGGCTTGHVPGSDHYDGHAIDVMITPYTDPGRVNKGWHLVNWLVANSNRLAIDYIIYRDRIYQPEDGWETYTHPSGNTSNPTLRHLDHIHVSVH